MEIEEQRPGRNKGTLVDHTYINSGFYRRKFDLITIHSHPDSFPPSINDINANFDHNYMLGIVICHDGKVYLYSADENIDASYYNMVVERFLKQGYNKKEAQLATLQRLKENFAITFREVTDYDI